MSAERKNASNIKGKGRGKGKVQQLL